MTARPTPVNRPSPTMGMASTSTNQTVAWVAKVTPAVPSASTRAAALTDASVRPRQLIDDALSGVRPDQRRADPPFPGCHPSAADCQLGPRSTEPRTPVAAPSTEHRDGDHHRGGGETRERRRGQLRASRSPMTSPAPRATSTATSGGATARMKNSCSDSTSVTARVRRSELRISDGPGRRQRLEGAEEPHAGADPARAGSDRARPAARDTGRPHG